VGVLPPAQALAGCLGRFRLEHVEVDAVRDDVARPVQVARHVLGHHDHLVREPGGDPGDGAVAPGEVRPPEGDDDGQSLLEDGVRRGQPVVRVHEVVVPGRVPEHRRQEPEVVEGVPAVVGVAVLVVAGDGERRLLDALPGELLDLLAVEPRARRRHEVEDAHSYRDTRR